MEFQEYPRWLYTPERAFVVQDRAEHDLYPDAALSPLPEGEPVAVVPDSARDALLAKAVELGVKVDRRWSDDRLAQELAKA